MFSKHALSYIAILMIFNASVFAQTSVQLLFSGDPAKNIQVPAIAKEKTLFVQAKSLVSSLGMQSALIAETRQLEFQAKEYKVRITPGNPFVSITDTKNSTSLVQLPFEVQSGGDNYYAHLESFIDLLDDVTPEEIAFDRMAKRITVGKIVSAPTYDISKVGIEQRTNGYLLRIFSGKRINDYESWLKPVEDGTWLYITLLDAKANIAALNANKPGGIVKDFLVFQSPTSLQLTFKLGTGVRSTELMKADGSNDILVAIHTQKEEEAKIAKVEESLERTRNRWKLDCIVIDAGHGGHDPGTIGVKKTKEKDVTLSVALKLGRLIEENMSDVRVVYTRKTDRFIELYRRGQIANAEGGKLFISIHCNSTPKKPRPANGFEIYLLRPGKTESAVQIAARENEVVKLEKDYEQKYQELTEEQFILVTMAQNAYVKYSEQFAGILQGEMERLLPVKNNGVKQAGFYVLVGASMPNVLIETGFLSNKKEEQYLKSAKGQNEIAAAIFQGVKKYKSEYEKFLDEGTVDIGGK